MHTSPKLALSVSNLCYPQFPHLGVSSEFQFHYSCHTILNKLYKQNHASKFILLQSQNKPNIVMSLQYSYLCDLVQFDWVYLCFRSHQLSPFCSLYEKFLSRSSYFLCSLSTLTDDTIFLQHFFQKPLIWNHFTTLSQSESIVTIYSHKIILL